ncbi:MAG: PAS domain-containing protein [Rhizobiales bacterium]|nr:PAS domain-containing protein [Hyphomicrobiales bacterium]
MCSETWAPMRHSSTRELFDYWNSRRGLRAAPDRADIEPGAIRKILADTFILSVDETAGHRFRIAGTRVCAAFGRELKNESFLDLWDADSRQSVRNLIAVVTGEATAVVGSACGMSTAGTNHEVELLMLPLSHRGRTNARVLGVLAPRDAAYWLGACTLGPLSLGTLRYLGPGLEAPPIAPTARPEGRIRHGFIVIDGGQT